MAALLAAAAHDVGHPGLTNDYLNATKDELAIRYLYDSPLENKHAAIALQTLAMESCDILEPLPSEHVRVMRNIIVDLILATDNANHKYLQNELHKSLRIAELTSSDESTAITLANEVTVVHNRLTTLTP